MNHELKCKRPFFTDVETGVKPFELRKHDRPFTVGDKLHLREVDAEGEYTGNICVKRISYLLSTFEGIEKGYCILGLL